jgi:hypothetical protein
MQQCRHSPIAALEAYLFAPFLNTIRKSAALHHDTLQLQSQLPQLPQGPHAWQRAADSTALLKPTTCPAAAATTQLMAATAAPACCCCCLIHLLLLLLLLQLPLAGPASAAATAAV